MENPPNPASKDPLAPSSSGESDTSEPFASGSRPPLPLRRVRRRRTGQASSGAPVSLWIFPLLAEFQLLIGAVFLTVIFHGLVLEGQSVALGGNFAVILACVFIFVLTRGYSWLQDLYMPRPVIFWGEGTLMVGAITAISVIVIDHLLQRGLGNLPGLLIVVCPLFIFLIRVYMIFIEGKNIPSSRRSKFRVDANTERMASLRRKLRHWMR